MTFGSGPLSNVKVTVTNFRPASHEESPQRLKSVREAGDVTPRVRRHDLHRVRAPHRRLLHVPLEYLEVPELPAPKGLVVNPALLAAFPGTQLNDVIAYLKKLAP